METRLGATLADDGQVSLLVWAPRVSKVEAHILSPDERIVPLEPGARGYHHGMVGDIEPGARYLYRLDGVTERPDPASRFQPEGVHGPSQITGTGYEWSDQCWFGLPVNDYLIYEVHVGAFTPEGTFDAIIPHLDELKETGITALELMPVGQFPGERNWGYDVAYPFAVHNSYGGPDGLKRLVDACHARGMAAILDVVYNHMGPEGNYIADFAPYFTERYVTPWGKAVNFDGAHSDEVRRFFIENALYWFAEYHFDALRLDAVHAILDHSPYPFLHQLADEARELGSHINRQIHLMPESAANDSRLIRSPELGGYGFESQWNDDFHHAIHTLLTGERTGYYQDYGRMEDLVKSFREGFVYSGEYSPYRQRTHGTSSRDIPAERFVVFSQNHDQVGNRLEGNRLSRLVTFEALKVAAGLVLLSPFVPLIFMGEEYGETAPFPYFISHSDGELVEAVREGRRAEFAAFEWGGEPSDPQAEETFLSAKLDHSLSRQGDHRVLRSYYRELIRLRKQVPALACLSKEKMLVASFRKTLSIHRWNNGSEVVILANLGNAEQQVELSLPEGNWEKLICSSEERWGGGGGTIPDTCEIHGPVKLVLGSMSFSAILRKKEE
ncbi:MAG: malto-oligosyltrehalose trehalohydrolase [Dehalococcoidia bacterium]